MNNCQFVGRLTADPELRRTQEGTAVCSYSLAVKRPMTKDATDFLDFVTWRQGAEYLTQYGHKGDIVAVSGALQARDWTDKNGNKRTAVEVLANQINFAGGKKPGGQPVDDGGEAPPKDYREPAPAYSQGSADDFAVISDDDDLPF